MKKTLTYLLVMAFYVSIALPFAYGNSANFEIPNIKVNKPTVNCSAMVSSTNAPVCAGQTALINLTGTPSSTVYYSVGNVTGLFVELDANGLATISIPSVSASFDFNLLQIVDNANSCNELLSELTVFNVLVPEIVYSGATTFCQGGTLTLTSTGASSYQWYRNGNLLFGETNQTYDASDSGLYTVNADYGSCSANSSAVQITVNPRPTATISGGGTVCQAQPVPSVSVTLSGSSPWTFTYSDGNVNQEITTSTSPFVIQGIDGGVYSISALNDAKCVAQPNDISGSASVTVVNANSFKPTINIGGPTTFCQGNSELLTSSVEDAYQWFVNGNLLGGQTSQTLTVSTSGSYSVVVTNNLGCTTTSDVMQITVLPRPTVAITGGGTVCEGQPVPEVRFNFTGKSPWTFTFSDNQGNQTITNFPNNTYIIPGADGEVYSISALSDANCTALPGDISGSASVTVNPLPAAPVVIEGTAVDLCNGSNVVLTSSAVSNNQWFRDGVLLNGQQNQTYIAINSGLYSVQFTDGNNCSASSLNTTVTLRQRPTAVISGGGTVCDGQVPPYMFVNLTGTGPWAFTYNVNGNNYVFNTNFNNNILDLTEAGLYTIVDVTDAYCVALPQDISGSATINYLTRPTATVSGGGTICAGDPLPMVNFNFTGTSPWNYSFTDGTTTVNASTNANSVSFQGVNGATYSILSLSDANCTALSSDISGSASVVVNQRPTAVISGGGNLCSGISAPDLRIDFTGIGPWTYGILTNGFPGFGSLFAPSSPFFLSNQGAGTYTMHYVYDNTGCAGIISGSAVISAPFTSPTAVVSGGGTLCQGSALPDVSVNFTGAAPWKFTFNSLNQSSIQIQTNTNPYVLPAMPAGTYTISTLTDLNCPAATGAVTGSAVIVVNPLPAALTGANQSICTGAIVGLGAAAVSGNTYSWTPSGGLNADNIASPTASPANTTTYTLVETISATGCSRTNTVNVEVNQKPLASASAGAIACFGGKATVIVSASGGTPPYQGTGSFQVAAGSYIFVVTDAKGCTAVASGVISQPTAIEAKAVAGKINCNGGKAEVIVSASGGSEPYVGTGSFQSPAGDFSYTITDNNGCKATVIGSIKQPEALVVATEIGAIPCLGEKTTITVSAAGGTAPYSGIGSFAAVAGPYNFTVTDANGCSATKSGTVTEHELPLANTGDDQTICIGSKVEIGAAATAGNSYVWSPSDGLSNANVSNPVASPGTTTTYTLTETNLNTGCKKSNSVKVSVAVSITCPENITVSNDAGNCSAIVNYSATKADCIGSEITYSIPSGTEFPLGTTIVTATVANENAEPSSCSFTVTVLDKEGPTFSNCIKDITVNNDSGSCGAIVDFRTPASRDNCSVLQKVTYSFKGEAQSFIIPDRVYEITVEAAGASGGQALRVSKINGDDRSIAGNPGQGGFVNATLAVNPGQNLFIEVGGQGRVGSETDAGAGGYNGGGAGGFANEEENTRSGGGGGGATDIRIDGTTLADRIIVAAGGGGSGAFLSGGDGGGLKGNDGPVADSLGITGAKGGSQTEGGLGAHDNSGVFASAGTLGNGGAAEPNSISGGGGAGWYGGGGGFFGDGAGGASYIHADALHAENLSGANIGDGYVTISYYISPETSLTEGLPSGSEFPLGTTENTFTAVDTDGNKSTCTFKVTVFDNKYPNLSAYTLLGLDEVLLTNSKVLSGGVGLFNDGSRAVLDEGSTITDKYTFLRSPALELYGGSEVATYNQSAVPFTLLPAFIPNDLPSDDNIVVGDGETVVLHLNSYGNIEIGKDATVIFNGNENVYVKSIFANTDASFIFGQATNVIVDDKMDIAESSVINKAEDFAVAFYVKEDAKIGGNATINADIYTEKKLLIENSDLGATHLKGQFIAQKIDATNVQVQNKLEKACDPAVKVRSELSNQLTFRATKIFNETALRFASTFGNLNNSMVVERSADGKVFHPLTHTEKIGLRTENSFFNEVDTRPIHGDNYYRLRQDLVNNVTIYSPVQKVVFPTTETVVFPNPTEGEMINVSLNEYAGKKGSIEIISTLGQLLIVKEFDALPEGTFEFKLNSLSSGTYFMKVKTERRDFVQMFVVHQK